MIRSVTDTTQHHDSPLALQTTAEYLVIRQVPSAIVPTLPTSPTFQNDPNDDSNSFDNGSGNSGLSKSVLEYIFIAVVVFIIACVLLRRYRSIKLQDRRRTFFSSARAYRSFLPPVELQPLHPDGQPYPPYPDQYPLTGIPAAYMGQTRPSRRTRAPDIDSSGRRLGDLQVEMDHNSGLGGKDDLPAYDNFGGPPKYFELDLQNRNRPPLDRTAHTPAVGLENTNSHPPTVQVSQPENNTPRMSPYFESSSAPMTRHET